MDSSSRSGCVSCAICLNNIEDQPICYEEQKKKLDCSHIFHRECIGEWLKQKHNCPLCRAPVAVNTPEAPRVEMTVDEILAVPDEQRAIAERLAVVRDFIHEIRRVRRLDLNEDTAQAQTARKVNSVETRIFGFNF